MTDITQQYLKSIINYDPETGTFTWIKKVAQRVKVGDIAGGNQGKGYLSISVFNKHILAHRLAFLYMTGEIPKEVDHINGDRKDNRWRNLRPATRVLNCENSRVPRSNNKSGYLGVSFHKASGKWVARIKSKGQEWFFGGFDNPENAHIAYLNAKRKIHLGCTI